MSTPTPLHSLVISDQSHPEDSFTGSIKGSASQSSPRIDIDSFVALAEKAHTDMGPTSLVQLLSEPELLSSFEPYDEAGAFHPVPLTAERVKRFSAALQSSHASEVVKQSMKNAEEQVISKLATPS